MERKEEEKKIWKKQLCFECWMSQSILLSNRIGSVPGRQESRFHGSSTPHINALRIHEDKSCITESGIATLLLNKIHLSLHA